jgi:hypothetical protein
MHLQVFGLLIALAMTTDQAATADVSASIKEIRAVGPQGERSAEAARAWKELTRADVNQLPELLAAMNGAGALSRNWLRSAADVILQRAHDKGQSVPLSALETFLLDRRQDSQARRFAYELVVEADPSAKDRFLPGMLDDPSLDLRRDAVVRILDQAEKLYGDGKKSESLPIFQQAFAASREKDQAEKAARRLKELGQPADIPTHFGFIMDWKVIGPFANTKQQGVDKAYPPEKEFQPADYDGKAGKVRWKDYVTASDTGLVDLNVPLGTHLESIAYARSEFANPQDRSADLRIGCFNTFKVWVNGELVLDRRDAYTGMRMDNYIAKIKLKAGKNVILVKVCQDIPPSPLPKNCRFQLRICDDCGGAVLSTARPAPPVKGS